MSTQIPVHFAIKFRDDFVMLSQQKGSLLGATVRDDPDNLNGKFGYFERIGATAMVKKTTRHGDTPLVDTPHSRRRVQLSDFEWADLIDKADAARMVVAGQLPGRYATNAMWAAGRTKDDLIIAAAEGDAFSIDENDAATVVPLPAAQKIAVGGARLTLNKIEEAREIFALGELAGKRIAYYSNGQYKKLAICAMFISSAELLVMGGEPIGEPIAMGGGFVMNTEAEIATAFADDDAGRMGVLAPSR